MPKKMDKVMEYLSKNGVETRRFFYPVHIMPPFANFVRDEKYKTSMKLSALGLSLPSYPSLSKSGIAYISNKIEKKAVSGKDVA